MGKPYSVANAFVVAAFLFWAALLTPAAAQQYDPPLWLYRAMGPGGPYKVEGGPYASTEECSKHIAVGADGIKDDALSCAQSCGCECYDPPRLEKQRIAKAKRHAKQHVAAAEPGCGGG